MQSGVRAAVWFLVAISSFAVPTVRAEVIEEIVALVDGDILTKSEYDEQEQVTIQDIYRRFAGEELDRAVTAVRRTLLMDLIDRKILVHRAGRMFDTERMKNVFYESFRDQQQAASDEEFIAMLQREGMTVESLKTKLIDMFAPDEVVRFEVSSRISVADHEVDTYYAEHIDEFRNDDEVELREIVLMADSKAKKAERRAEAEQLHARLTAQDFAQIAAESSEAGTKSDSGYLGIVKRGDLSEKLEDVAFVLMAGTWSDVLEMPYGFHILYAENRQVGEIKSLEEVRDELRIQLEDNRFSAKLSEFMNKARGESEWCVKAKFVASLPAQHSDKVCEEM
jgi:parvulin-like peptidyl-prolyl isomerase